eukprot:augustus_masked-scaffold_7-processed-gene-6.58-mRNA-1 protein AED:1.00 eAED:1.00 QI:0/0/0/0/1/1/2/0/149
MYPKSYRVQNIYTLGPHFGERIWGIEWPPRLLWRLNCAVRAATPPERRAAAAAGVDDPLSLEDTSLPPTPLNWNLVSFPVSLDQAGSVGKPLVTGSDFVEGRPCLLLRCSACEIGLTWSSKIILLAIDPPSEPSSSSLTSYSGPLAGVA